MRWAEVDVAALIHNTRQVRARLAPDTRLMAMVKSDGYGHGAGVTARAAVEGGAAWLGVYTAAEALALRDAGLDTRTLVVGWSPPDALPALITQDVDIAVLDANGVAEAAAAARAAGHTARIHLKVDTGMSRLGFRPEDVEGVLAAVRAAGSHVDVAGVFTHFAAAESDDAFTALQHERFVEAAARCREAVPGALLHTAGSAAILGRPETHHDLVRLGIAMYGYAPPHVQADIELRPAMTVLARVAQVRTVAPGETVGYERTWRATGVRRIATVAMGYGQGLPRALSNRGVLVAGGARCPITGIVNMDQVSVDVSDAGAVEPGDVALVFGGHGDHVLGADEMATLAGTIPHELLCGVGSAMERRVVAAVSVPPAALP